MSKAYFAGGCFWCITPIFESLDGVFGVRSGYCGGDEENPTYQQVKEQRTSHRETIEIDYEEEIIDFKRLMYVFMENVDPFDEGGQFIDRGHSYTLAVYYTNDKEKEIAQKRIDEIRSFTHKQVYVSVEPFKQFWPAEEYHQDYHLKNPEQFEKELVESGRKVILSNKIELPGLRNTRDLGGMVNSEGKTIKPHKLIRSNYLYGLPQETVQTLCEEYDVKTVVDLRTPREKLEKPDCLTDEMLWVDNQVQQERATGVTKDEESKKEEEKKWRDLALQPEIAKDIMRGWYTTLADTDFTVQAYGRFLKHVLENENAILWHCSLGKDRCGVATALVLECLGFERKTIIDDYMHTNDCLYGHGPDAIDSVYYFEWAHKEYIEAFYGKVEEKFGNVDNFLQQMGIGEKEKEILKDKYLQ